jgi:hypothetical protein
MFERTELWSSPLSQDAVLAALSRAFTIDGAKVSQDGEELEVRRGSNWRYRLWGNLVQAGRKNAPVGLTLRVSPTTTGSDIEAHAFDTFGFRIIERAFFGAQETFEQALERLLDIAAVAAKVETRSS